MNKRKFILSLRKKLKGLPSESIDERVDFYIEMINDRMEEGFSEEDAIFAIGSTDKIVGEIMAEEKNESGALKENHEKRFGVLGRILLILGSPIWLSLIISAFAVVLSLYVSLWAVVISLWAVLLAFTVSVPASVVLSVIFVLNSGGHLAVLTLGAGAVLAGLSVFGFFGCKAATKGSFALMKIMFGYLKKTF